jgi:hypothetical protein
MKATRLTLSLCLAICNAGCGGGSAIHSSPPSQSPVSSPMPSPSVTIANVSVGNLTTTSAIVSWTTNVAATSEVEFGTTTLYGSTSQLDSSMVSSHSVAIHGLNAGTLYHYRVHSVVNNQEAISGDFTFSTQQLGSSSFAPLCLNSSAGSVINADPSNYQSLMRNLKPADTLSLVPGNYPQLQISGLSGTPTQCITITGPSSGPAAVIQGAVGVNTVEIFNSSYVAIKNLTIDSLGIDGAFGISAHGDLSNLTHHILIEGNTLVGQGASQQTDSISTKTPTWGWVIRKNRIIGAGTGIYLGNSDGTDPFVAGVIEDNLIQDPVGYCMEIKYQLPRPALSGMPTSPSSTIIRNNVFLKNDQPSPDGDRPNLLVGGFPDSGPGSTDLYEIYGNFFYHNPREALFQGSGRISFHDNILVDGQYAAAVFRSQDLVLKLAFVYNNTIYTTQSGIQFGSLASTDDAVIGNLVFAAVPISGSIANQEANIVDTFGNAAHYVNSPAFTLGSMNFYPLVGQAEGPALDLSKFSVNVDYNLDFNWTPKGGLTFRGAYAGAGVNPGWQLQADIKPVP